MGQWVIGNIGRSRCDLFSFSFPTGEGIKVDPLPKFSQSPKKERTTQHKLTQNTSCFVVVASVVLKFIRRFSLLK